MRKLLLIFLVLPVYCFAQQQTFDITTYAMPKGWKVQSTESTIKYSIEDEAKGSYRLIMLFKSLPGKTIQNTVEELMQFEVLHHSLILYAHRKKVNCENRKK